MFFYVNFFILCYTKNGDSMNIIDIINKKRKDGILTFEEIEFAINGFLNDEILDSQMSSLLMAMVINGMSDQETFDMTDIMLKSGDVVDLSSINGIKVDKHSTGGVGDKTSLIVVPLVASCGVKVAKMSGRGLGHTGGTIDKLESIDGFNVNLSEESFIKQVNEIGCALISQTFELAPADKKIYALRDKTATVESIPLIAASIMSKKLASGADKIVIDVKVGEDAFMKEIDSARELAKLMVKIGKNKGKEVVCVLTNMEQPLGNHIGNALEVHEAIKTLNNDGPKDLVSVVMTLASIMVSLGKSISIEDAKTEVEENLRNGKAYQKFKDMVAYQQGNIENIPVSKHVFSIKSSKTGFITEINAYRLGMIERSMNANRFNQDGLIDATVGFVLNKKIGDYVLENEELLKVYLNTNDVNVKEVLDCFEIKDNLAQELPLIYEIIK